MEEFRDNRKNCIVITDMDEVLTNISPIWYKRIRQKWDIFKPYFRDLGNLSDEEILRRDVLYLEKWLIKDSVEKIPEEVMNEFYKCYRDDDFYSKCKPTTFGRSIIALALQSFIKKIYITTHTMEENRESKEKFYLKYFNYDKIDLIMINGNTPKSKIINDMELNEYVTFIDDSPKVIKDVMENTNSFNKEFVMPSLGYNSPLLIPDILELSDKHNCVLRTYTEVI